MIRTPPIIAPAFAAMLALVPSSASHAGSCTPSTGPDVIVAQLNGVSKWGTVNNISAYSIGTVSCNIGDEVLIWTANANQHPVIAQNLYRLKDGRFEQIGMSWIKHGWGALTDSVCCPCQNPGDFEVLGVGCSDPYDSGLNGNQGGIFFQGNPVAGLGPRSDVNPSTGLFSWPYPTQGQTGNAIYKRMQVRVADLDPALNGGALYFAEGQYISPHDSAAGNGFNNVAHRRMTVGAFTSGSWTLGFTGQTSAQSPAIEAWFNNDPGVQLAEVDVPGDGRFIIGSRCTDNGNGTWHYEYAVYNMNSHRAGATFSVPLPAGVNATNVGFHDIDHHSGEPFDPTDWQSSVAAGQVMWGTSFAAANPNANALRWGSLYNFRFDADAPPAAATATLGLFRPGAPGSVTASVCGPSGPLPINGDLNGDGEVDGVDLGILLSQWFTSGTADLNGDRIVDGVDLGILLANWTL